MIYPPNFPTHNSNHAERKVFEALKQLDPYQFDVFWNRTFAGDRAGRSHGEEDLYEIDFLVFDLREECLNHIFVIEVKGGRISFSAEENKWYQSGREMDTAPDVQAMRYASNMIARYAERIKHKVPVTWLLWFPDGLIEEEELPTQFASWRVADQSALDDPLEFLELAKEEQEGSYYGYKGITPDEYKSSIYKDLTKGFGISPNLKSLLEEMKISIELAESHQKIFFTGLMAIPRLAVEGGAGSGKTVMAKCGAEILHEQGKKVLFLCYNRYLFSQLEKDLSAGIKVDTILNFMVEYINGFEPRWFENEEKDQEFFNTRLPDKFKEVLKKYPIDEDDKFDAIFIDEAQDMELSWLNLFLKFLKPEAKYLLFYDPRQNIFEKNFVLPISESWTKIPLQYNYRNTIKINDFINDTLGTHFLSGPVPEGEKVQLRTYRQEDVGGALYRCLKELNHVGKLPLEKIKIITDGAAENFKLEQFNNGYCYELLDAENEPEAEKVYYTSIHRFKGCESEVVILLLKRPLTNIKYPNTLYTQLSRAKSLLYVLEPEILGNQV